MIRIAAALILSSVGLSPAAAEGLDCAKAAKASDKFICADPTLSALEKEGARLVELARSGAHMTPLRRKELSESQTSFRKTLSACKDAKPCRERTLVEHIHRLREGYFDARSKDGEGISLGPMVAVCPGLEALVGVTFVNSNPAFAFLAWRDKSLVLTSAPASSGARYMGTFGSGEAQFWDKGKEAAFDLPGKPSLSCQMQEPG